MKKSVKKRFTVIMFVIILLSGILGFTVWFAYKASNNNINIDESSKVEEVDKNEKDREYFGNFNRKIELNNMDKMLVINKIKNTYMFDMLNFKRTFFVKFLNLLPLESNLNLNFYTNDINTPKQIQVKYMTETKNYDWFYKINI